jgi:hypothetical protein
LDHKLFPHIKYGTEKSYDSIYDNSEVDGLTTGMRKHGQLLVTIRSGILIFRTVMASQSNDGK